MDKSQQYSLEEILPILEKVSRMYNSGESSSISYETGEMLMEGILYTINQLGDVSWREGKNEALVSDELSAEKAYELGKKLLIEKTKKALQIYKEIMKEFKDYGVRAYRETVVDGMGEFFKWYDVDYFPQESLLMLDYPLEDPINGRTGIDLIYDYLVSIADEQKYLSVFPEDFVSQTIKDYHFLGGELLINVKFVLKNS